MNIIVCCNSDSLAFPTIIQLEQQGLLSYVCVPHKSYALFASTLKQLIPQEKIVAVHYMSLQDQLTSLASQSACLLTITFPWYLTEETCQQFELGTYNIHFSLLPKYAGKDPLYWQLAEQEKKTGFTIHQITQEIDGGPILFQKESQLIPGEHYGLLAQRLGQFLASSCSEWVPMLQKPAPERSITPDRTHWESPGAEELTINWSDQTAEEIQVLVAAANPKYGGATCQLNGEEIRILEVLLVQLDEINSWTPGTVVYADETHGIVVKCKNGTYLRIMIVQSTMGYTSGVKLFQLGIRQGLKLI